MHVVLFPPFIDLEQNILHRSRDLRGGSGGQKLPLYRLARLFQARGYPSPNSQQ